MRIGVGKNYQPKGKSYNGTARYPEPVHTDRE